MIEWNQILREEWYSSEKPDELVVNFATSLRKQNKKTRVLDLGCGAGRNLVYMASQGFEAHGLDTSETGLNSTKERLRKRDLKAYIAKGDVHLLPYRDTYFDAVMCLFVIYHQKLAGIQVTISEIHRVLRKRGVLIINFQSKQSHMYGKGTKVERDTFIQQAGPEKGIPHHFSDKQEITRLLKDFQTTNVKLRERKSDDGYFESRWIVTATT
ncbi:class I SAM-dependent methyltransferase [Candidatus Bathyarchaeota archaeon]|nr:class I SAM-dependent methyltransferase [Candidatus Bathyarchaeota archaeon]